MSKSLNDNNDSGPDDARPGSGKVESKVRQRDDVASDEEGYEKDAELLALPSGSHSLASFYLDSARFGQGRGALAL